MQHGNTLIIRPDDESAHVRVDAARMRQVLQTLISKGCKFSDDNSPVVVGIRKERDVAVISIENTGPPIPESFQGRIFDAFTQSDGSDTRSLGGTGLGLNIARQIVIRLGGQIGFEQKAERRTVFWFTCQLASQEFSELPIDPAWSNG